jgi:glycosyltransferase involved in cell wall biosynthesis
MNRSLGSTTAPTEGWLHYLPKRGLKPVVVSRQRGSFHDWILEQGIPAYLNSLADPSKYSPWRFFWSLSKLYKICVKHRIELIHCNEQNIYPIGQYLGKLLRIPVVVSVHFTMERGFSQWAFDKSKQPDRMFFVSKGNLDACREAINGVVDESRWRILNNAIDTLRYIPDPRSGSNFRKEWNIESKYVIGVACALRARKQVEHFFEVTKSLGSDFHAVLAGGLVPGDEPYADELIKRGKNLLGEQLSYVGHLEDLRPFCNALDLFINTSKEESFGIAALEAMACGTPVVGYPSKAVDCVVLPGGGVITPQDDPETLVKTVRSVVSNRQWLNELRAGARERAVSEFDWKLCCDRLWGEYESLINK